MGVAAGASPGAKGACVAVLEVRGQTGELEGRQRQRALRAWFSLLKRPRSQKPVFASSERLEGCRRRSRFGAFGERGA